MPFKRAALEIYDSSHMYDKFGGLSMDERRLRFVP
jgi:hypothetical protein